MNTNNEQYNKKDLIQWRREKILLLSSQGYSQRDIADKIKVCVGTVNKDLSFLREQAKENIKKYVNEKIPEEYEKCLTGLSSILKETWDISLNTDDNREKMQALSLAKECYSMKLDLLTNVNVVNDVIRFISSSTNNNKDNIAKNQNKANDEKYKDYNITIEKKKNDIQRPTENNNSTGSSPYNSIF